MGQPINELIILSAAGLDGRVMQELSEAISEAGYPGVMITNEEFKVTDLDKLEDQLHMLLNMVKQIKKENAAINSEAQPAPENFQWGDPLLTGKTEPRIPYVYQDRLGSPLPSEHTGKRGFKVNDDLNSIIGMQASNDAFVAQERKSVSNRLRQQNIDDYLRDSGGKLVVHSTDEIPEGAHNPVAELIKRKARELK